MDHFAEHDLSSMVDSVDISTSELNCMAVANPVPDTNHERGNDGQSWICSLKEHSADNTPGQMAFSKNEPPVFEKPFFGTGPDPPRLTKASFKDYPDVGDCCEATVGHILNTLEKKSDQSSECPDTGTSRGKNDHEASVKATEKQDYICRISPETEGDGQSGSFDDVIDGVNQREMSFLNLDHQCSSTTESENGCPLKTEEQMKKGFLTQDTDCDSSKSNKNCNNTTTTQIHSVCSLEFNAAKQNMEGDVQKNAISTGNIGTQENDCHLQRLNNNCEIKNDTPADNLKHVVKNTAHDVELEQSSPCQEVEHSSFEFLQSCFALGSLNHTKLDQNAANILLSESAIQHSQNCNDNQTQTPFLVNATFESVPTGQTKETADIGLQDLPIPNNYTSASVSQEPGHQNDTLEDQIFKSLSRNESTYDMGIKMSASLLSSKTLLRKLQPVVLVKATTSNVNDGNLYVCSVCQKHTRNLDELIEHHHCDHSKHTFQYCLSCGVYFCNETLAVQHLCEKTGPNDMKLSGVLLSTTKQLTEKLNAKYLCQYCQKPFVKLSYHQDHEQRHRNVTQYRCNCCGLYFPHAKKLAAHKRKVKCTPLVLESNERRKKGSETDSKNSAKPIFTSGADGCQVGLHDCFVKLVDINKGKLTPQRINCPVCGKRFKLRAQLKVHIRSHTSAKSFKCNKCKKVFKYSWNLEKHKKECPGNIIKQHISESAIIGRFSCPTCPQVFKYSYNRTRHMRQRCLKEYIQIGKGKVGSRYKCPLCDETFSLASNRNRHIKNSCFQQYKLQRKTNQKKMEKETVKEEKEEKRLLPSENLPYYKCKVCPASFAHKSGVYRHMKKHSLPQHSAVPVDKHDKPPTDIGSDSNNERPQSQDSIQKSSDVVTSHPFLCSFCDKSFDSSYLLNNHLQLHVGKKPFQCLDCGKNFGRRGHLITHKNVHKRRIQCSVCKKIVPTIGDLLKHRQSHIKKGMLQCPDCPMQFKFPVYLLRHVASHAKKVNISNMSKTSLPDETPSKKSADEKVKELNESFFCELCQKGFVDSKTMSEHCLAHLPKYPASRCLVCKHNFTSRAVLIRHMRLHTGEKPFPCKKCGMHFHRKEPLRLHIEKCTGSPEKSLSPPSLTAQTHKKYGVKTASKPEKVPKKFTCSYCPHIFTMSCNLKMHEKAHLSNNLVPCLKCGKYFKKNKICGHRKFCNLKESTSGEAFNSRKSPTAHKSECKDTSLVVTNRTFRISKEMGANIKDTLKEQCPCCSKQFQYRSYLLRHLRSHLEKESFACKHCGQKYGSQCSCEQHEASCDGVLRQHESKQLNESKEAQIIPGSAASLKQFTAIKEENREQLKCNFCTKTFTKSRNLRRHILTHTDVKPYQCKMCENCFSRHDHLKRHQTRCRGKKQHFEVHFEQNALANVGSQAKGQPQSCKLNTSVQPCRETSKLIQCIAGNYSNKWKFQCEYCPRRFKNQTQLKMHTRLHTGEKPFGCASCDERFIRRDYLKRHLTKCNGKREGPKVLCEKCGGLFTPEALDVHKNNCVISLTPTDCPISITSMSSPSMVKTFSCLNCNDSFLLFSQLQQHILTKHRSDELQQSSILEYEKLSNNLHIKEEPDDVNAENLLSSCQIYVNNGHKNTDGESEKPYECEQCNMRFLTNSGLGMHMRTHTAMYPLSCKKCNKGFWSKNVQKKHLRKCKGLGIMKKEHNSKDVVSSEEYTPNDKVLVFNKGTNTTGTGVLQTKFSCKDQDKGNTNKVDAVVHKYQCSECEQSFTDGLMLISHLEAHGREDQERRLGTSHHCHVCGKTFDQAGMLQRHVKTQHQETIKNTCPECFRSFRFPSDLDIHRSCHDPNRPFVCDTCQLRFWTSKSLNTHQRLSHLANEPLKTIEPALKTDGVSPQVFTCQPCNKVYTIKRSYMKHCRVKHKGCSKKPDDLKGATTKHQSSSNKSDASGADDKDVSDDDSDSAPYFPCHVCGKTFLTSESLEDHQRCHLGEKPYECEECGKCFVQLVNLQQHQRSHKSEFQCQMCGKGFVSLFALRKHKHTHVRKRPHQCTKCPLSFTRSSQLTEHMITHRDENFPCDLCHENFSCKSSRAEHRKIHTEAEEELPPLIPPVSSASVSVSPSLSSAEQFRYRCENCQVRFSDREQFSEHGCNPATERPYSCKDCNKHFLHGSHLKKHQLTHQLSGTRSFQCNSCHMSFSHRHHFLTHLQTHGGEESSKSQSDEVKTSNTDDSNQDKIYRCPICPESFSQVLELANHLSVHANKCNVCNKTFSTKQQLEKHEQCHLSAATQYECTECGKNFLGSDAFRQHYCVHQKHLSCASLSTADKKRFQNSSKVPNSNEEEEVDVGEDFHNCCTCNKRFPSIISLQEHQKLHEFDRPFKCLACGKTFTKKKYLKRHQQVHNERPYQCDLCSNSFQTEQSLLSHSKTHDAHCKYHCSVCAKSYRTPYDLSRHEQKHPELHTFGEVSGDHRCDMCYKSFGLLSQLRQHQETHVGQVVYECTECDKAFAFLHLLEEHQKSHGTSTDSFQSQSPSDVLFQCPANE